MTDIKILTVPFDPRVGLFDDEALVGYLKNRVKPNGRACESACWRQRGGDGPGWRGGESVV
jgi:hypothetical protein